MTDARHEDRNPTPDVAEENAYFPSPYSLTKYTSSKTDFDGTTYPDPYKGGKWKILMMRNGKFFFDWQPSGRDASAHVPHGCSGL